MIITKAQVAVDGRSSSGTVELTLIQETDGWTYAVAAVAGGQFTLPWRASTPEAATKQLRESYRDPIWRLSALDTEEENH